MNNTKFLMLILTVCLSAAWIRAQPSVEQIAPNAREIVGVTDAKFSASGKFMVVQTDVDFFTIPIERLDQMTGSISDADYNWWAGWAKGFMPSGKILVKSRRALYTSDPQKPEEGDEIYSASSEDEERGTYLNDGEMVVVNENLIVSGDDGVQRGLDYGNIIRFDVRRGRYTRAARIKGFRNPSLSPSGRYVLYEYGEDLENYADLYDIARDVNYQVPQRFDFKRHFPKFKEIAVAPLGWFGANRFAARVEENQLKQSKTKGFENLKNTAAWLIFCDAATGKIVWKRELNGVSAPAVLQPLSRTKAFFDNGEGLYELRLADGKITKLPGVEGALFSISPDKTKMAFLNQNRIIVSAAASGADKKTVLELPESWQGEPAFDATADVRSIEWSPDGKRLLVTGENRLLIVRLNAESQNNQAIQQN